jgi:prepilin-type N-terminal cleavage/methylation domain-containing protein
MTRVETKRRSNEETRASWLLPRGSSGFTLIELLVVISIIGILASIISISASRIRAQARDSRRIADLKVLASGLEIYFAQYKVYPTESCWVSSESGQKWIVFRDGTNDVTSQYFPGGAEPRDPRNNSRYHYEYCAPEGSNPYHLRAFLETNHSELRNDPIQGNTNPNGDPIYDIIP